MEGRTSISADGGSYNWEQVMRVKLKPLHEQVVVLVGATSGIGRETAFRMSERGARLVLSARSETELDELVEQIERRGGKATAISADVSIFDEVNGVAEHAINIFGRIDSWVNLAAVSVYAPLIDTTPDEFKRVIDVSLLGQSYGAMAALPHMMDKGGAIIFITSVAARRSMPLQAAYSAAKYGVRAFADSLRLELIHDQIPVSVTNIMPSSVNTPFFDKSLTRLGVKPRPIPPVYDAKVVADAIMFAAEHPVREMYAGGAGKSLGLLQRVFPPVADTVAMGLAYTTMFSDEPKSPEAAHNLFEHIEGYDRVDGEWDEEAIPQSPMTWLRTHPKVRTGITIAMFAIPAFLLGRTVQNLRRPQRMAARYFLSRRRHKNLPGRVAETLFG
jgi:NAD(P)-dependent dehydrogenase (short-subunit alcohol dehydrogenase family)